MQRVARSTFVLGIAGDGAKESRLAALQALHLAQLGPRVRLACGPQNNLIPKRETRWPTS